MWFVDQIQATFFFGAKFLKNAQIKNNKEYSIEQLLLVGKITKFQKNKDWNFLSQIL